MEIIGNFRKINLTKRIIRQNRTNRFATILPGNNSPFCDELINYIKTMQRDIAVLGKDKKTYITISPTNNYEKITKKYNMNVIGINFNDGGKASKKLFVISPPYENTKKPFKDKLLDFINKNLSK